MKTLKTLAVASIALLAASASFAAKINGSISFNGTVGLNGPIATATEFTSFSNVTVANGTQTAGYAGLDGLAATMNGFQFDPVLAPDPVDVLWQVVDGLNTYSFVLEYLTGVDRASFGGQDFLTVSGKGTASATGYDDAVGVWSITTQSATGASTLSFSSTTSVPDAGATSVLLGLGLVSVVALRRFKK
jgi:hypothetical protein